MAGTTYYTVSKNIGEAVVIHNATDNVVVAKCHERLIRRTGVIRTNIVAAHDREHAMIRATALYDAELLHADKMNPSI